ncbi:acyl-CoA dehydratase activase-related protein [Halonatronum saccharophilum]|uniref:acyl-CoA dehydratase activase-related protein n=1 Tax=Halonatronum saccharophilum TaxID=150060 RepID=UPI0004819B4C|nr:acyl-CoA dehydratase activase-related protein [Halonatronum saccharophilum]
MKITFPHMGTMAIPAKALFEELGFDVILPPPITKKTLDLGVKHSPEFACLPLKMNVGNYIEALELGADTIIMGGGVGPCRFGYYGEVQKEILRDLGYEFEMIIFEPMQGRWKDFYKKVRSLLGKMSLLKLKSAWDKGWAKAKAVDRLDSLINKTRPYLIDPKKGTQIYKEGLSLVDESNDIKNIEKSVDLIEGRLNCLKRKKNFKPLKVGLVGEIYVVLEPFTNLNIEEKLGELGVLVDRSIFLTDWIKEHMALNLFRDLKHNRNVREAAKPYLNHFVGGHGIESVGETVLYSREGYDGVIHLLPFTCMPEIIAQSVLPTISKEKDIPVLSLSVDEHTGDAGFVTRLEAFIDLLARKKEEVVV